MLFRISENKKKFWKHHAKAFSKSGQQYELLPEDDDDDK
jgi:hypothetical protein